MGEGKNPEVLAKAIENGHLPYLNHLQIMPRSLPLFLEAFTYHHKHMKTQQAMAALEMWIRRTCATLPRSWCCPTSMPANLSTLL